MILSILQATVLTVFPNTWLFETIPGSDVLLVSAPDLRSSLPIQPTLTPQQLDALGGQGWLNTDNHPIVEWRAPGYLHYATARLNQALIEEASEAPEASP